jgi:hypothetical protein
MNPPSRLIGLMHLLMKNLVLRVRSEINSSASLADKGLNPKHEIRNPKQSRQGVTNDQNSNDPNNKLALHHDYVFFVFVIGTLDI